MTTKHPLSILLPHPLDLIPDDTSPLEDDALEEILRPMLTQSRAVARAAFQAAAVDALDLSEARDCLHVLVNHLTSIESIFTRWVEDRSA